MKLLLSYLLLASIVLVQMVLSDDSQAQTTLTNPDNSIDEDGSDIDKRSNWMNNGMFGKRAKWNNGMFGKRAKFPLSNGMFGKRGKLYANGMFGKRKIYANGMFGKRSDQDNYYQYYQDD